MSLHRALLTTWIKWVWLLLLCYLQFGAGLFVGEGCRVCIFFGLVSILILSFEEQVSRSVSVFPVCKYEV